MPASRRPAVGDLWLVDFGEPYPGEPAKCRPALILGPPNVGSDSAPPVILVPITTTYRDLPSHVEIDATTATGLQDQSYAQCELIRSVSAKRLTHRLGSVGPDVAGEARRILGVLLSI